MGITCGARRYLIADSVWKADGVEVRGYEDFELIGSGGNARVYRAIKTQTGETVAVKILRGGGDPAVTRRFERERSLMAELETITNVVPIHESGLDSSGDPYLVMPLYTGGSLQDLVDAGPTPWREAVELAMTLTESVALAHAKRILHLDVKPANVLLDDDNALWLADFGIAEMMGHTASMSAQMMTPAFTPPERLDGQKPGEQTDLYGLMATLYALLTGRAPYVTDETTGPMSVMMSVVRDPLPMQFLPEGTHESVRNLLLRGMAKDPAERPRSAIELVGLLEDILDGRDIALPISLLANTSDPALLPVVVDEPAGTIVHPQPASMSVAVSEAPEAGEEPPRRKAMVLASLAVLLAVAGGFAAAFALSGDGNSDTPLASDSTSTTSEAAEELTADSYPREPETEVAGVSILAADPSPDATSARIDDRADTTKAPTTTSKATVATTARPATTTNRAATTTTQRSRTTTTRATATTKATTTTTTTTTTKPTTTTSTSTTTTTSKPTLEAGFRAQAGGTGNEQTVSFRSITVGEATSYRWTFGDGSTGSGENVSHTFDAAGTYSVTITASGNGITDSATHSVRVDRNSIDFDAGWTASASVSPNQQTIVFRSITIGPADTFTWNFGDGTTGSGETVTHTYAQPGTFSVTLTVTGSQGTDTAVHPVRVDESA